MAIEPYRQSVAVRPTAGPRIERTQAIDIGGDINRFAGDILDVASPHMAERAKQRALEDAGAADLVKDEQGNYQLPDAPKGGMIYARVYDESIHQRFITATATDFETFANEAAPKYRDDPQGFLELMGARAEAKLAAAPARIRGDLETRLNREVLERHRGLAEGKARRDYDNEVDAIGFAIDAEVAEAVRGWRSGSAEGFKRGDEALGRVGGHVTRLVALGEMSPEGSIERVRAIMAKVGDERDVGVSLDSLRSMAPLLSQGTDEELQLVSLALEGVDPYPGEPNREVIAGMTFSQFKEAFPSAAIANQGSSLIGQELGRRQSVLAAQIAERRHQETLAAQKAEADATEKLVRAARQASARENFKSSMGYSEEELVGIEADYGNIYNHMRDPGGRDRYLGLLSQYGHAPKQLTEYIDGSINGDQMMPLMDFIRSAKEMNVDGNNIGETFFNDLAPSTRNLYMQNERLARMGYKPEDRQAQLEAFARKTSFSFDQSVVAADARKGTKVDGKLVGGYTDQKNEAIARLTGAPLETVRVAKPVQEAFDQYFPLALQANDGNVSKAIEDTANSIKGNFLKHPIFLGGFGPGEWKRFNPRLGDLSAVLKVRGNPKANPSNARLQDLDSAGRPRVRLQPLYDTPLKDAHGRPQLGRYLVRYYDTNGNPSGSETVDMDDIMGRVTRLRSKVNADAKAAADKAATTRARGAGSRWELRKDPKTGQTRYMLKEGR